MADIDLGSESLRFLGGLRFPVARPDLSRPHVKSFRHILKLWSWPDPSLGTVRVSGVSTTTLGLCKSQQSTVFTDAISIWIKLAQYFSEVYTVYCLLNPRPLRATISFWPATASTSPLDLSSSPPALDQPLPEGPWVTLTDNFSVLWAINMAPWRFGF